MRCCVPFCKNTSDHVSTSEGDGKGISFHGFPYEVHLRAAWLRALGKEDSHLPDSAVVCSWHFLNDDIYETESGLWQIVSGAIPSTVQVCMICLDTDGKLILMSKHKLEETYEKLTGHPLCDQGNLKQTLCVQCAQRLINFSKFRDKSLRARELMMDLVERHELITKRHIKMINRTKHQLKSNIVMTTLGLDHCDLHILEHFSEDKQTELEETEHIIVVKTEESDDSMSVDEDMEVKHEEDSNVNDFVQDPLKNENSLFQCTLSLEEFVHEHEYIQYLSMHLQNGEGDGECDTSQVCEPHTAVSSSSSHSSLITENKQADPGPSARAAHTSVTPSPASLVTNNEIEVIPTEEVHTNLSYRYKRLTDCFVKLYDIFAKKVAQRPDGRGDMSCDSLTKVDTVSKDFSYQAASRNEVPTTEYIEPVTNSSRVSVGVVKTLQSNTSCLNNVINTQCINSSLISTHTRKILFICDICRKTFKRKGILVKHIKTHTEVRPSSRICEYKCKYRRHLSDRMRTHTGDKSYTCKICNSKFTQSGNLVVHMRTHTGDKPFTCKICNSKFAQKSNLVSHMRTHTGEKPYSCKICKNKFVRKRNLKDHMRTHTGEKPFICKICNRKFTQNSPLVRHMRTHTGEKPYSCKICEYKFASKSNLKDHMRSHTGEKPFTCKICDVKFAQNRSLVSHMRTHTGEKPYTCKICEYKFAKKNNLKDHMRIHTGEKPFTCKICDVKFAQNRYLVSHMRTHTGEKPYSCKICEYKFASQGNLNDHMRTHTGEKPFTCKIYDAKFIQNRLLVSHTRTHTGEKPSYAIELRMCTK